MLKSDWNIRFFYIYIFITIDIYNLFNAKYCSNGYGYSYMWDGERYDEAYYFPQAPLHVLANVTIKF